MLLSWLQIYGYPALWLCICIAAVGIPLPVSLILLALGAFAASGNFNLTLLFITAVSASVCGDCLGYGIGRKVGPPIIVWLSQPQRARFISPKVLQRAQAYFQRHGGWAVFLSRCIVPVLGGTINILAGVESFPFSRFLLADILGESIGAITPIMLGYIFGASWESVGTLLSQISTLILVLLIAIYLIVLLLRTIRKARANQNVVATAEKIEQTRALKSSLSQGGHKRVEGKKRRKKTHLFATLERVQTYKSTDGLQSGYSFPIETRSNTGNGD
jgi:membrane-associated protein